LDLANATIAVTGATGFLGRYVVEVLLARGARVVAVVRNPAKAPELADQGVEVRRADLAEPEALAAGFSGCDAVVSNAGLFSLNYHSAAKYLDTNIEGTRNVLDAAAKAGVERVVQVSSSIVYEPGAPKPIQEDAPLRARPRFMLPWKVYAASKALSEQEAWRLAGERGLRLSTVRPTGIYGAFDQNLMRSHKAFVRLPVGVYPVFFYMNPVYAGDVGDAIARCLEREASVGRAYNLATERTTAWDLLRAWRTAGGRTSRLVIPIPVPVRMSYSIARAREELGWENSPMLDGMRATIAAEAAGSAARRIESGSATPRLASGLESADRSNPENDSHNQESET
jgi:dihydroflavonol-4-reductase